MRNRVFILVVVAILTLALALPALARVAPALGVPAYPGVVMLKQPDGKMFSARQWGDEHLNGWETADGYSIVKDQQSGYWCYAKKDENGNLVSAGVRADGKPPADIPKHLRPGKLPVNDSVTLPVQTFTVEYVQKSDLPRFELVGNVVRPEKLGLYYAPPLGSERYVLLVSGNIPKLMADTAKPGKNGITPLVRIEGAPGYIRVCAGW